MTLEFPEEWRFEGLEIAIPSSAHRKFVEVVQKICSGGSKAKWVYETFQAAFGFNGGSSNAGFAEQDMQSAMVGEMGNAATYIDSFWAAIERVKEAGLPTPSERFLNRILRDTGVPLSIVPPRLVRVGGDISVTEPTAIPSTADSVYQRVAKLGGGGFGIVYKVARTTSAGEFYFAMKVFDPVFMKDHTRPRERFNQETAILSRLKHRGIALLLEAGVDQDEKPYILMPLIEGDDLHSLPASPLGKVIWTYVEILNALEYAHSQNVLHRDLKPANVMIQRSDGQPILVDFGSGFILDDMSQKELTTKFVGTSEYAAPEVTRNPSLRSPQQDVYSVGVMLYETLTNMRPDPDDYIPLNLHISYSRELDDVIKGALAPQKKRLASAGEFRDQLQRFS